MQDETRKEKSETEDRQEEKKRETSVSMFRKPGKKIENRTVINLLPPGSARGKFHGNTDGAVQYDEGSGENKEDELRRQLMI